MNDTQPITSKTDDVTDSLAAKTIGTVLREKRLAAGLSPTDIADKIKVTLKQVEALEQDQFQQLPGNVFIRGFIRSYARIVDVDAEPLLAQLQTKLPNGRASTRLPELYKEKATIHANNYQRRVFIRRTVVVCATVFFLAIVGAVLMNYLLPKYAEIGEEASRVVNGVLLTPDEPIASEVSQASTPVDASSAASAPAAAIQAAPGVVIAADDASTVPAANTIQLRAVQDSWVRVIDSNQDILFNGTVKAGAIQNLGGKAPYRVRIGNAPYTTVSYDGKTIELAPFTQGSVATLTIQ